jgi:hypothetical protein
MTKTILAVIAGSAAWTMLWFGMNAILRGASMLPSEATKRIEAATPLLVMLLGSVVFSIAAGYVAAAVGGGDSYTPVLVLCALQLALGIFFQAQAWQLLPLWYHLPFLLLIVPATLFGGWLRLQ